MFLADGSACKEKRLIMTDAIDMGGLRAASGRYGEWWPMLCGPLAIAGVYVAAATDQQWLVSRAANEDIALPLVAAALVGFAVRAWRFGSEFHLFMAVLCAAFFCREWHFAGTSKGIYIAMALLAVWAVKRRAVFERALSDRRLVVWFWATFVTYVLSQLIARRLFRHLGMPLEDQLHVLLEETVETTAHLMMIVTCLVARSPAGSAGPGK